MTLVSELFPEAYVFDLDGTLVDSMPGIASALAQAFESIGRKMPAVDLRQVIGPPIRVIAKRVDPKLTDEQTVAIEKAYRPLYDDDRWQDTELFDGVGETLMTLHKTGRRAFVVTNKPRVPALRIIDFLGIKFAFEAVVTRDSVDPPHESKAAMLKFLMGKRGLKPESTVMVGDTVEDHEAATANEVPFCFASYGYGEDAGARCRLANLSELLNMTKHSIAAAQMGHEQA